LYNAFMAAAADSFALLATLIKSLFGWQK